MESRPILSIPDVVMILGLVPAALWLLSLAVGYLSGTQADLHILAMGGALGFLAYLVVCLVSGCGALWALAQDRRRKQPPARMTRILSFITASVMVLPWVVFGVRSLIR